MSRQTLPMTLRALARLIAYPNEEMRENLGLLRDVLDAEHALSHGRLTELDRLIDELSARDGLDSEARYVDLFDRGRATSLHLFEHVHGDSRDRGPAMIDLGKTYAQAGLYLGPGELPDYLPVALEFASMLPPDDARAFLAEMGHILNAIHAALVQRQSAYAAAAGALLELAGEKVRPLQLPPEEPIDESWAEPVAFDGCASRGQGRPDQPKPIQIVRRADAQGAPTAPPTTSTPQGASA
jgi:nitrate reductase molybdenum cofactor assembly chaperone NarJ/NarW